MQFFQHEGWGTIPSAVVRNSLGFFTYILVLKLRVGYVRIRETLLLRTKVRQMYIGKEYRPSLPNFLFFLVELDDLAGGAGAAGLLDDDLSLFFHRINIVKLLLSLCHWFCHVTVHSACKKRHGFITTVIDIAISNSQLSNVKLIKVINCIAISRVT